MNKDSESDRVNLKTTNLKLNIMAEETDPELEQKRKGVRFICRTNRIEIPEEFKMIAIRANFGNKSPLLAASEWPTSGSVYSKGERGLFGLTLSQDMYFIEQLSFCYPEPNYMILEVDAREAKIRPETIQHRNDVEFWACNVLFSGGLSVFINQLKQYATPDQYARIRDILDWKVKELTECKTSELKMMGYILRSQARNEMFKSVKMPGLLIRIAINNIKNQTSWD